MGMTVYSCITPIAQMSRKRCYLRVKASGCWLLFSINQCCHWQWRSSRACRPWISAILPPHPWNVA